MRMKPLTDFREFRQFLASFTNYERLPTFRYDSRTLGLERMRSFVHDLGDPQNAYPCVHVGGTKGKGTTTLMLEALLGADGARVGTYTSPHIEHLCERIRVGGAPISGDDIVASANATLAALERRLGSPDSPTFFELMTAIAMLHFSKAAVDYAIFEVGLGGRLDATNILSARWSALTSVGLEHTDLLGDSLAQIATEKAGIIRPSTPVVCGALPTEAREVVAACLAGHTLEFPVPIRERDEEATIRVARRWFMLPRLLFGYAALRGGKRGNARLTATLFSRVGEIDAGREVALWAAIKELRPESSAPDLWAVLLRNQRQQ